MFSTTALVLGDGKPGRGIGAQPDYGDEFITRRGGGVFQKTQKAARAASLRNCRVSN